MMHVLLSALFCAGACFVGMIGQPPSVSDRARFALLKVLFDHSIEPKHAANLLGYSQGQWAKMARGDKYYRLPPVDRLIELLPVKVLKDYLPELAKITLERYLDEGADDAEQRRTA